ncbi:hypothetical protein C5B42_01185 [Candidatus Cerribacteria bacterium 'Amazon FNV 2010 28 9']|uniref:Cell division protein FtsL n=1 Tax=Candidatus Cerribacteria bacterium 'Amazon FNV 2010 28 9' TaxID=2081795 RepID=A0A317JR45_9BACT|nr:MAG: hypothetical protein C5B42_01185 [Candidatus Cerribacteria bacterium 'Amazon FNV 2010 28 9']
MNRRNILIIAAIFSFVMLIGSALSNVVMAAHISDVGAQTKVLEQKANALAQKNEEMLTEIATKQSLTAIQMQAQAQGFVPRTQALVISDIPKLASAQ